jgi:hypothetical protein
MSTQKERPILFKGEMVRAILDGSKTQTRRIVKLPRLQPWQSGSKGWNYIECSHSLEDCNNFVAGFSDGLGTIVNVKCPYGKPADPLFSRPADWLWVRETFGMTVEDTVCYRADEPCSIVTGWRPSIFMPRWASRSLLEVTDVRVERLQSISEEDARAEGISKNQCPDWHAVMDYQVLWESINGPGSWAANPWVWVVEFRRVQP